MANKIRVGITPGDLNGIGLEIILKSLSNPSILNHITPVIYASGKVVSYHKNVLADTDLQFRNLNDANRLDGNKVNVMNCWEDTVPLNLGQSDPTIAKYAVIALEQAVSDHKAGLIDAIVTGPIDKHNMKGDSFPYPGHTEYFGDKYDGKPLMVMADDDLRVAVLSGHIPVSSVSEVVTKELVQQKVKSFEKILKNDFHIQRPNIAILGLNPHAGDQGVIGMEEVDIMRPAIVEMKKQGQQVFGPYAADGLFASGSYKRFDGILAMYHDQGLIPFKILAPHGVNFTGGLNLVRVSPDHGTAFDLAGKGKANHESMLAAIFTAKDIVERRLWNAKNASNPVKISKKQADKT